MALTDLIHLVFIGITVIAAALQMVIEKKERSVYTGLISS
jgi:hypothetical protein